MLTLDDIQKLSHILATKQDLEKVVTKQEFEELKDNVMDKMDSVYKEVIAMRQEQAAHQADHDRVSKRIEVIEAVPSVAHDLKR